MSPDLHLAAHYYAHSPGMKSLRVQFAAWQYLTDVEMEGK